MKRYYVSMAEIKGLNDSLKARAMRKVAREFCLTVMTEGAVNDLVKHLRKVAKEFDGVWPDTMPLKVLRGGIGICCCEQGANKKSQDVFMLALDPVKAEYSRVTDTDREKTYRKTLKTPIDKLHE